jgi:hypothetical protein
MWVWERRPCGCVVCVVAPCPTCDLGDLWAPCPHNPDPPIRCEECMTARAPS